MNLIPQTPGTAPNYWCTWALQNYIFGQGMGTLDPKELEGMQGAMHARNSFTQDRIFGNQGWAKELYAPIRSDLFLMLDDGWDVPNFAPMSKFAFGLAIRRYFGSFVLDHEKFPDFDGNPEERLRLFNEQAKAFGWRGIGLWIAAQEASKYSSILDFGKKKYWQDRYLWCKYAGINYWKVDWGIKCFFDGFRRKMTLEGHLQHPDLLIEHASPTGPFNDMKDSGRVTQKYLDNYTRLADFSDILRLYDISPQLTTASMLDRVVALLKILSSNQNARPSQFPLLNCEDEVYMAAALGCTMGIMRYPYRGLRPAPDLDFSCIGPHRTKERIDEAIRAILWERIAPPFSAQIGFTRISKEILFDGWHFKPGDFWDTNAFNKTIKQGAPMMVFRNMELPQIPDLNNNPDLDQVPFLVGSRNPNGSISIAALGRTDPEKGYYNPRVDLVVKLDEIPPYLAIFGYFNSILFHNENFSKVKKIWIQDLRGTDANDVSSMVEINQNSITITNALIEKYGLKDRTPMDISDPGLILKIE